MSEDIDWITLAARRAKGKRPQYFDDPALDRLYSVVLALAAEVSVLRERLDTHERILEAQGILRREDIENYRPDREAGRERALATRAYVARIMRGFQQEMEAMMTEEPPIEEVVEQLSRE